MAETIWMTCPYDRDLCGADATLTVTQIDSDQVEGLLECVNGHRWKLARLADLDSPLKEDE
jgi:hypothetical protein